jgi:hypothetical protein
MNEVELIRTQLATERRHATLVAGACVRALEEAAELLPSLDLTSFCQTCVDYLVWVLVRFEARDRSLLAGGGEDRRKLAEIIGGAGHSRDALARLQSSLERATPESLERSWREFAQYFSADWSARRLAVDEIFGRTATLAEWRSMASIDERSILDERNRFVRVQACAPPGIELRAVSGR